MEDYAENLSTGNVAHQRGWFLMMARALKEKYGEFEKHEDLIESAILGIGERENRAKDPDSETVADLKMVREALEFYANRENFRWEGCHCHGSNVMTDTGEKADIGLGYLDSVEEFIIGTKEKEK
jgi:hypothetical protein